MRTLYLLRHAKSSWIDPSVEDYERPLAPRGRRAAARIADYMHRHGFRPDLVLCSPARRARETWALMAERLDEPSVRYLKTLYLAPPSRLATMVARLPPAAGSVLIVGHNPGMEAFASRLAGGGAPAHLKRLHAKFPTAALAVFRFDVAAWRSVEAASGRLADFVRPNDLD
ncbi:MAG: histidine phosphatase family protein [Alphaproteobacteria bacterium]|nr:histidine phosphatase family protein [Alphaproteobacteria bacterium]